MPEEPKTDDTSSGILGPDGRDPATSSATDSGSGVGAAASTSSLDAAADQGSRPTPTAADEPGSPEHERPDGATGASDTAEEQSPAVPVIVALEEALHMRVIVYFGTGAMSPWDAGPLHKLLETMGPQSQAALVVQSPGGDPDAAHFLASILHEYIGELHIHIPSFASSAATLLALSADQLWMGPVSELSPIDPQVPIDPRMIIPSIDPAGLPGSERDRFFIPAHVIRDFLELAGVTGTRTRRQQIDTERLRLLIEPALNPWILGMYERFDKVSRVYAREALMTYLLKNEDEAELKTDRIVETLCDYYASHDAYILRGPARRMGLPVTDCPTKPWELMRELVELYATLPPSVSRVIETVDGFEARTTARRTCPGCSETSEIRDGHIFCPACGRPFETQCEGCGEPRQEGWSYCPRCGTQLATQESAPAAGSPPGSRRSGRA